MGSHGDDWGPLKVFVYYLHLGTITDTTIVTVGSIC